MGSGVTGGDATENTDYTLSTKTLTFAAGVKRQTFTVTGVWDTVTEEDETIDLELVAVDNAPYTLGDPFQVEVVILNRALEPTPTALDVVPGMAEARPCRGRPRRGWCR